MIKVDLSYAKLKENLSDYQSEVDKIHGWIHEKTHKGNDYLGWVDWPLNYDKDDFSEQKDVAKRQLRFAINDLLNKADNL